MKKFAQSVCSALLAVALGAGGIGEVHAVGSASLTIDPSSGSHVIGSDFIVTVHENSGAESVNAVEADLSYDQSKLQFINVNTSGSVFSAGPATTGGNGSVSIVNGSTTSYTGDQIVGSITFRALASTTGTGVAFASSSAVVRTSDSANLWNGASLGGTYVVGPATLSTTQLLADANGDGKSDAVVMFKDTGIAMVALSTGSSFTSPPAQWSADPRIAGADKYFLGDVNGDGKADLVGFWNAGGVWRVMYSNGAGFQGPPVLWATNQGIGTAKQWLADVNGDGKADTVTFDAGSGDWYASLSTGSGFGPLQKLWSHANGVGSTDQFVADFTGDGKADLGVYFAVNGSWYVTPSAVTPPFTYAQWSQGHGLTSNQRLVGDINGGGKADEAFFFNSGHWDNGLSSGGGFFAPVPWANGEGVGTTERFLADVNGDGMADLVTFDAGQGDWNVDLSSGSGFWPPTLWIHGHGKKY